VARGEQLAVDREVDRAVALVERLRAVQGSFELT
jgi:hypothetical protein